MSTEHYNNNADSCTNVWTLMNILYICCSVHVINNCTCATTHGAYDREHFKALIAQNHNGQFEKHHRLKSNDTEI